ncbi:hypothetical protein BRC82_08705 [Halobacteriales archaeon QS_1_67_19]|nr:MAG: hypothetical protein BRC82_08705 [Halobacteriales archaeon QS_1_67_19]
MSLAEETREAARNRPFLLAALRAGVVNYTAAARFLADDVGGDPESVATALRRFAETLPDRTVAAREARVSMRSGLGEVDRRDDALLVIGDAALAPDGGSLTGVLATGETDPAALSHVLDRLAAACVEPRAAATAGESLLVVVERRDGPDALRVMEDALEAVPAYETR